MILEYYQPKDVISDAIISIEYVVHGYRYININQSGFGISESCQVDVNCSEGQDWQIEKRGVALIIIEGNKLCTGSLINTTDLSQKPYLLTANHCFDRIGYDAYSNPNLDYSSFYWDYEAPGCNNANTETPTLSTSGATILANDTTSDFALLDLSENPKDLSDYTPYYLGWDRTGESGEAGVCIHHPHGDMKKISTVSSQPRSSNYQILIETVSGTHWGLNWRATTHGHGTTEGGSSGSPLLTADHKIIGQLQGGFSGCSNLNGYDWYGKFDLSWTGNSNINSYRRLNCWLDSLNMGMSRIGGLLAVSHAYTMDTPQQLYGNICINNGGQLFIQDNVEIMGNNQVIVETGGTLVIDGGKLTNANIVMKTGSLLRIINNGIIETQNGFNAPLGTTVEIENGQIE